MTNANDWDSDALALLGNVTRELKFDWSAIAEKIKKFFEATETFIEVTPAICRQQYAKDYSKKSVKVEAVVVQEVEVAKVSVTDEAPAELVSILKTSESLVSENYSTTISTQQIYEKYNEMTVEELIIHCDEKEKVMNQRKEQIFQNVLNSLGGMKNEDFENQTGLLQEIHEMKQKYYQQLEEKELDKLEKKQLALELLEKQTLEEERAKLKRRFDLHSEDNIGENPFEFDSMLSNHNNHNNISSNNNIGGINSNNVVSSDKLLSGSNNTTVDTAVNTADNANLATPNEVSVNLEGSIFSYGGSEEQFDSILSELERELEQKALVRAQSKGNLIGDSEETSTEDDTPASELWEVLSVLELAAKQNQLKKSTVTTAATGNNNNNSNSSSNSNNNSSVAHNKTIVHYLTILNDSSDIIAADKKNASATSVATNSASNISTTGNNSNNNINSTISNSYDNVNDEYNSDNDATVAPAKSSPLRSTGNNKTTTSNHNNSNNNNSNSFNSASGGSGGTATTSVTSTSTVNSNRIDYYSDQSDSDGKDDNHNSGSDDSDDEDWKSARLKGKNRADQFHNSATVNVAGTKILQAVPDMTSTNNAVLPPQPPLTVPPVISSSETKSISFSATNESVSNEEESTDLLHANYSVSVDAVPVVAESPVYLPPPVVVKTGSLGIYSGSGDASGVDAAGSDNSTANNSVATATITPVKRVKGKLGGIMNNTSRNNRKANTGATTESVADEVA